MAAADGRGDEELPRDAKVVETILRSMGVQQHEPRVINQFLDLWYRYVGDVLSDAQAYSEHAGKSAIDCDDARLAVQSRVNSSFSQPPPRETLMKLAKARNNIPLPKVIGGPGIALPPDQDTLIAPNYQLALPARVVLNTEDMEADLDESGKSENEAAPNEGQYNSARKVSFALAAKRPKN